MSKIVFAAISPHPPLILPSIGAPEDRAQVKNTIENLKNLGKKFREAKPKTIIISSPHPDWGFNVPLYFLAPDFSGETKTYLIGAEDPKFYFDFSQKIYKSEISKSESRIALIASADLSHCLKEDGPYGFSAQGPRFDEDLIESLKSKDMETIFKLNDRYPGAGECGLRSICFMLGILEASGTEWEAEILSYEGPFGVGYLVAGFQLKF